MNVRNLNAYMTSMIRNMVLLSAFGPVFLVGGCEPAAEDAAQDTRAGIINLERLLAREDEWGSFLEQHGDVADEVEAHGYAADPASISELKVEDAIVSATIRVIQLRWNRDDIQGGGPHWPPNTMWLVFRARDEGWMLMRSVPAPEHVDPNATRLRPSGGNARWLDFETGRSAGTGLYARLWRRLDLHADDMTQPVFSMIDTGNDANSQWWVSGGKTSVVDAQIDGQEAMVVHMWKRLRWIEDYSDDSLPEGRYACELKHGPAVFLLDPEEGRFRFDQRRSVWTEEELENFPWNRVLHDPRPCEGR